MLLPSYTFSCRGRSCGRSRILAGVDCAVSEHPGHNSARGRSTLPITHSAFEPRSHVPSRSSVADSDHPSYFDPNFSLQRVRRNAVPVVSSAPEHSEHHFIAPRRLRVVLRGELPASTTPPHPSHALSSLHPLQPRTLLYDINRVPGLEPKRTLLPPFVTVVSYETYRLHEKRTILAANVNLYLHRIKRKLEGLIWTLKPFNGTNQIKLFRYFAELRYGFDALGVPEAAAVRSLHFPIEGEARTFYESFAAQGTLSVTRSRDFMRPHEVHVLLDRYLTESELHNAHDRVTLVSQRPAEDENSYADRIIAASHDFSNFVEDQTLVHYYFRGFLETSH